MPTAASATAEIESLLELMARLRDPAGGCPWDLHQTFRSILPYTLEEAYEVAEAIERNDLGELRDELGDLLLQVVFHAQMGAEQGAFDFADVVHAIRIKMIRRHPHVFGSQRADSKESVPLIWEQEKQRERISRGREMSGVLAGVASALPALARAEKLQKRAARVGFDWESVTDVMEKVYEELVELRGSIATSDRGGVEHEVGDLLFSCVNLARHLGVDAEQALRHANGRFEQRFRFMEACLAEQGLQPTRELRERMDELWEAAKEAEIKV